ncbi:hypothetical protein HELRODRAFT_179672 [Helobdella robusta]|uniref:Transmembrane protein 231 n=1 Tax=Helobdella robusta TaxID=6412 RepID=T1FF05_HELRO|nr:hypothetical protein HELRODRAFT_179672 [Helobdella robusta]ESN95087.1 hypothetical protein HELRODRAFT_179672 [Helobdella robusta]
MATLTIYSKSDKISYKSSFFSVTSFLSFLIFVLTWVLPFIIVYHTSGFLLYLTEKHDEKPLITFKHQMIMEATLKDDGKYVYWSTYEKCNVLFRNYLRIPTAKTMELTANDVIGESENGLQLNINLPLAEAETVFDFKILLFINYRLQNVPYEMMGVLYLQAEPQIMSSNIKVNINANFNLIQYEPLPSTVNYHYINAIRTDLDIVSMTEEIRPTNKDINDDNRMLSPSFHLNALINYNQQQFKMIFERKFASIFRWAYIQFIYLFLLFHVVSSSLWRSVRTEGSKLNITYRKEYVVNFTTNSGSYFTYSTSPSYNDKHQSNLRIPLIKIFEEDIDEDGLTDNLNFELTIPILSGEHVMSADLIIFINYTIMLMPSKELPGLVRAVSWRLNSNHNNTININKLHVTGRTKLIQREPLTTQKYFEQPTIDSQRNSNDWLNISGLSNQSLFEVLVKYTNQNSHVSLIDVTPTWMRHDGARSDFKMSLLIGHPHQHEVTLHSTFWHSLKWAFIQYSSIFIFLYVISNVIMTYLFENRLVDSIIKDQ